MSEAIDVTRFFHPILPFKDLKRGPLKATLNGQALALFRNTEGRVGALLDACPHRLAPLSGGRILANGRLACFYHGWSFDVDGSGRSPSQPGLSRCDATAFQVVERHGFIWVAHRGVPMSRFPSLDFDGYEHAGTISSVFPAPLHVVLDNFAEDEHTPWIHRGLGWGLDAVPELEFEAHNHDDHTEVHYSAPQRPPKIVRTLLRSEGRRFHNDWTTHFDPVRFVYDVHWTRASDGRPGPLRTRNVFFLVPETDATTRLNAIVAVQTAPGYRWLLPLAKRTGLWITAAVAQQDRKYMPLLSGTPKETDGMRFGRFDKPVIHNRRLLERIYWGGMATSSGG